MILIRTVKFKLKELTPNDAVLLDTFLNCTKAFNYICEIGYKNQNFNSVSLHHETYQYCRTQFNLPSELASQVRMQAAEAVKAVILKSKKKHKTFKCPNSKQIAIRLCKGSFNVWFDRNMVSILTCHGRIKTSINISPFVSQYVSWKRKQANLQIKDDKVYLNITFEKEVEDVKPDNTKILGIDRGIANIATLSDETMYSGEKILKIKQRYQSLRSRLQSCGSKSAKRHLRKVSSKENRFVTDVNHCISKDIIARCEVGTTLVLEKLTGIRDNSKKMRKVERAKVNSWSFYQLEQFLTYKALAKGCAVQYVDARYTSQKCSKCSYIYRGNRKTQDHFKCLRCGYENNADINAAINIANNFRASVNKPIVAGSNT